MNSRAGPVDCRTRRAVIDIGSNSVKALVADVSSAAVDPIWEDGEQTRLAAGALPGAPLLPGPVAATAVAVARFAKHALRLGASTIRAIATSAAREAANPGILQHAVRTACGLEIEIASGDQEAAWSFAGASTLPGLAGGRLLVIDVGGGSTELASGVRGIADRTVSVALGAVRLMEALPPGDPPSADDLKRTREAARVVLERGLARWQRHSWETAVGVGGTPIILAQIDSDRAKAERDWKDEGRLTAERIAMLTDRLWTMPAAARRSMKGLPSERADVILFGAVLYETLTGLLSLREILVSSRGLRFGVLRS